MLNLPIHFGSGFKKYFVNTSWLIGGRVIRAVSAFLVGIFVIRYLGPDNFGMLTYANTVVLVFMVFGRLGFDGLLSRDLVNHPEQEFEILGSALALRFAASALAWAGLYLFQYYFEPEPVISLIIIITASCHCFYAFNGIDQYFQSIVKSRFIVIAGLISMIITLGGRLISVEIEADVVMFAVINGLEAVWTAVGFIAAYRIVGRNILNWRWSTEIAESLLKNCWPLIISSLSILIYTRIDQVMIREMLGIREVGIYAVAVTLSEAWYFLPLMIANSLFPAVLNAKKRDTVLYTQRLSDLYQLMFWMGASVAVVITLIAAWLVPFLYGDAFAGSSNSLRIMTWSGIFLAVGIIVRSQIMAEKLNTHLAVTAVSGALLNIVLNYFLIQRYGIEGAAMASVVAFGFASFFGFLLIPQTRHICLLSMKSFFKTDLPRLND